MALLILLAACIGKGFACWLATRLHGEGQREALAIGTLMNARGLMELIILNIGLEQGIITPLLFTILVIMAIATTLMASPVFELAYKRRGSSASVRPNVRYEKSRSVRLLIRRFALPAALAQARSGALGEDVLHHPERVAWPAGGEGDTSATGVDAHFP